MPPDQPRPGRPSPQGAGELTGDTARPEVSVQGRVARNTLFSALGEGSNALLFLLIPLATRWLGPTPFGVWQTAAAFVGLFRVLPDFGMAYASTLEISRDRSAAVRLTGGLLGFQAFLSLLTVASCLGLGWWWFGGDAPWVPVAILSFDLVFKSVKSTLRFLLKSLELFNVEAVSLLAERMAILLLGSWALMAGKGVVAFVLVFALVHCVDAAGLWAYIETRVVPLRPARNSGLWRELLRKGLPFAYAGLVVTLIFQVDAVLLGGLRGPREVGWYRTPTSILEGLTLVPRVLGYALIPVMASLVKTAPVSVAALYRRGCKYLLLVALPIGAFGLLASDRFIPLIFGPAYGPSVPAARILIPAIVFMFLSNFSETTLACIDRWRTIVVASTAALVLNVALNLALIPAYGYLGSSWATLATEAFYCVATTLAVAREGFGAPWLRLVPRPAVAAGLFSMVLWLAAGWPLILDAAAASITWVGATFLLRIWDAKERQALAGLVAGRRPDLRSLA